MSSYYFYFIGFFRVKFWCISQNSIVFPHSFGLPTGWWSGGHPSLCESVGKYFLCWGKSICWSFDDGGESQLLSQTPLSPFACPRLWPHHHCICILYFYFVFCLYLYIVFCCVFLFWIFAASSTSKLLAESSMQFQSTSWFQLSVSLIIWWWWWWWWYDRTSSL